jgi:tRNA (adenine57-N1/adenine58-N1)-methyltransferase
LTTIEHAPPPTDALIQAGARAASRSGPFAAGDLVVATDHQGRCTLHRLKPGARLHITAGGFDCDGIIGADQGILVRTNKGEVLSVFRPTLEQYLTLMPRAAQIITPKDVAMIVQWADVFPGALVVEAGMGSGSLTLGLLRAVGAEGHLISFELRPEFANRGKKNVEAWDPALLARLELRLEDVHSALLGLRDVDRIIFDLPDPVNALPGVDAALRVGGIVLSYLPTIRQVDQLVLAVLDRPGLSNPEVIEAWVRPWKADRQRLRPESRITGHTGFLVRFRRLAGPPPSAA